MINNQSEHISFITTGIIFSFTCHHQLHHPHHSQWYQNGSACKWIPHIPTCKILAMCVEHTTVLMANDVHTVHSSVGLPLEVKLDLNSLMTKYFS